MFVKTSLENKQHAHQCCKFCTPSCCITQNMHIHVSYLCTQTLKYCKKSVFCFAKMLLKVSMCANPCVAHLQQQVLQTCKISLDVFSGPSMHIRRLNAHVCEAKPIYANQEFANLAKPYADVHTKFVVATWQATRANVQTKLASLQKKALCKLSVLQDISQSHATVVYTWCKFDAHDLKNTLCKFAQQVLQCRTLNLRIVQNMQMCKLCLQTLQQKTSLQLFPTKFANVQTKLLSFKSAKPSCC